MPGRVIAALDAAGEGAGAPAVPGRVIAAERRGLAGCGRRRRGAPAVPGRVIAALDAAGEGAGAPAVPGRVIAAERRGLAGCGRRRRRSARRAGSGDRRRTTRPRVVAPRGRGPLTWPANAGSAGRAGVPAQAIIAHVRDGAVDARPVAVRDVVPVRPERLHVDGLRRQRGVDRRVGEVAHDEPGRRRRAELLGDHAEHGVAHLDAAALLLEAVAGGAEDERVGRQDRVELVEVVAVDAQERAVRQPGQRRAVPRVVDRRRGEVGLGQVRSANVAIIRRAAVSRRRGIVKSRRGRRRRRTARWRTPPTAGTWRPG